MKRFREYVYEDSGTFIDYYKETLIDNIFKKGYITTDVYDYKDSDEFIVECVDTNSFDLLESAAIIKELSDFEETDSGLWCDLQPEEAIEVKAIYTYKNAVIFYISEMLEKINESVSDLDIDKNNPDESKKIIEKTINEVVNFYL